MIPFQIKPREYEDWMKNSDEKVNVGAVCNAQKQHLGGRDYSHTWIINEMNRPTLCSKQWLWWHDLHPAPDPWRRVLLGILGGDVLPGSLNPELISDQISKIHTHFWAWPNLACSTLSDSWEDSPVVSHFIFMFALSQFSAPNYLRARSRLGLIRQKLCHYYQVWE